MIKKFTFLLLPILMLIVGCAKLDNRAVNLSAPKIISTIPSNTEILIELGVANQIIAVDQYSLTEQLDQEVLILDFFNLDLEALIMAEPDIIIASVDNKIGGTDPFLSIKEAGVEVVYVPTATSINDIYQSIEIIGEAVDKADEAKDIIQKMKTEIVEIKKIAETITTKKEVYLEISPAPYIYTTGRNTFQNELIETVGAKNIFSTESGWFSPNEEAIIDKNPDIILTNVDFTEDPIEEIKSRSNWSSIEAIKNHKVYLINSNFSSRPSQNIIKALKEIAVAIYPEYYE